MIKRNNHPANSNSLMWPIPTSLHPSSSSQIVPGFHCTDHTCALEYGIYGSPSSFCTDSFFWQHESWQRCLQKEPGVVLAPKPSSRPSLLKEAGHGIATPPKPALHPKALQNTNCEWFLHTSQCGAQSFHTWGRERKEAKMVVKQLVENCSFHMMIPYKVCS